MFDAQRLNCCLIVCASLLRCSFFGARMSGELVFVQMFICHFVFDATHIKRALYFLARKIPQNNSTRKIERTSPSARWRRAVQNVAFQL